MPSSIPPRNRKTLANNRNYILQNKFVLELDMFPGTGFTCQNVNGIGGLTMPITEFDSRFKKVPLAGNNGLIYDDLNINFIVSEDLKNYYSIHKWLMINGHSGQWSLKEEKGDNFIDENRDMKKSNTLPESSIFYPNERENISGLDELSDGRLYIYDSNNRKTFRVDLSSIIPYRLSGLSFNTRMTSAEYMIANCIFKYQKIQFKTYIDPEDPTQRLDQPIFIDEGVESIEDQTTHYRPASVTEEIYKSSNSMTIPEAIRSLSGNRL